MAFHTFDIVYPGEFLLFESNARTIWLNITLQVRKTPSFCAIFALKTIIFTKTGSGHKHKENSKKEVRFLTWPGAVPPLRGPHAGDGPLRL
jgi:hypothetical protein